MNPDSDDFPHNEHLDDVLQIISKLARKAAVADYIYRGEPEQYERISSSFYRDLPVNPPAGFDVDDIQEITLLEDARRFAFESDDLAILTELQHYGGKTNLIDFTADYHIALFFACDGRHTQDGRVIFLERNGNMKSHIHRPRSPVNRVIAQKSAFVRPPSGYIEVDPDDIVIIPSSLKFPILEHLRKAHGIYAETVYNDLHGFIRYAKIHQDAFRHLLTARTNLLNSDYRSAIDFFTKSIDLNPTSLAYSNRGDAYIKVGKYDDAISDCSRAIAIDPNNTAAYAYRGVAKARKGNYDSAIDDYDRAIAIDPNYAAAYNNRGVAKARKGDHEGVISDCSRAITIDPNNAAAYNNRGVAKLNKGDYDDAIDDYSRSIELEPDKALAYYNRGGTWLRLFKWDNAKADFTVAKSMGIDIIALFRNEYGSVANFEQRNDTALPPDIAEMLGG